MPAASGHRSLIFAVEVTAARYRAWVYRGAVGLVVLPFAEPDRYALDEARLVREHSPPGRSRLA